MVAERNISPLPEDKGDSWVWQMLRLKRLTVARSRTFTCPIGKKESLKDIAQDYEWSRPWSWQLSGLGNECSLGILRQ